MLYEVITESSPLVDARLPDGSRVNVIIPPLSLDGSSVSIRRFGISPLKMENLIENKSLTEEMARTFGGMIKARLNILVSGGTGAGKTTFRITSYNVCYTKLLRMATTMTKMTRVLFIRFSLSCCYSLRMVVEVESGMLFVGNPGINPTMITGKL